MACSALRRAPWLATAALLAAACTDGGTSGDAAVTTTEDRSVFEVVDGPGGAETTPTTIEVTEPEPTPSTTVTVREPDAAPVTSVEVRVGEVIESFAGETTSEGTMLTLEETILFDFDSAELRGGAGEALDDLVEVLEYYDEAPVEISGHTDGLGTDEYNDQLSLARAEAVVAELVDRGIEASRLTAQGYGSQQPVADEELDDGSDDPDGRAANRRVELLIVGVEPPS